MVTAVWIIYQHLGKYISEKTHIFLCKQSVGLICPNIAARNERGRLSLKLAIDTNILNFFTQLQAMPDNNIARQCL